MKIVIAGAGKVGIQIAKQLIEENRDVVIIERDPERVKLTMNSLDCMVVHGEANNRQTLMDAHIEDADFFISVTEMDELNMIACGLVSSEFQVPKTIARVRNIDYSHSKLPEKPFLGIDYVVNPEIEAAKAIIRSVEQGATSDIMYFEDSTYQMRSLAVTENSLFIGKSVMEVKRNIQLEFIIAVILRDNDYTIPTGSTIIERGDVLYLIGSQETLEVIFSWVGKQRLDLKRVVVVGGGAIGRHVVRHLLDKSPVTRKSRVARFFGQLFSTKATRNLVVIEKDYEICKELSEEFQEALIINGDVSDEGILEEGDLNNFDLLIAATDNQELNLITALYAKSIGIGRALSLVQMNKFLHIASHLDIDTTVSTNATMVNTILKFVRKGNIRNVHALSGGKLEIIEVSCDESSTFAGKRIRDLKLPHNTLIVFISHGSENIIPTGDYMIEQGDNIVLITNKEAIKRLDKMLDNRS